MNVTDNILVSFIFLFASAVTMGAPTSPHLASEAVALLEANTNNEAAPTSLTNQILCGYQGWFTFPGDGSPLNRWKHWFADPGNNSTAAQLRVDMFPTIDEYDDEDLKESEILLHHGNEGVTKTYAKFFSSVRPNVVLKHFEWMANYGITGVFHARFMQDLHRPKNRETKTMVLRNVRNAAEATGRSFAINYNIAGEKIADSILDDLKADWMRLVDEEGITKSPRYMRQNGLPVLSIYGIGFKKVKVTDTNKMADLIHWFQHGAPERYRVFVLGGVPSRWRVGGGDSREGPAWQSIYNSLDGIQPWHVGRWHTIDGFERYLSRIISIDAAYCAGKGILYMPTMWPGFSWHNLRKKKKNNQNKTADDFDDDTIINNIPRLGGQFLWKQAYGYTSDPNINSIWMAQFDEVDEGTAIFKVAAGTSDVPVEGNWLSLDADGEALPEDWYLRLAGEAQLMLDGKRDLTARIPIQPEDQVSKVFGKVVATSQS